MSDDIIKKLRVTIAAGPTPGPWEAKRLIDNLGNPYATLYQAHIDLGVCMVWAPIGNSEQEAVATYIAAASPDNIAALLARLDKADEMRDALLRNGFVECDIPACNCGSWHHRYGLPERMREIKEALSEAGHDLSNENGHSILRALNALIARLDKLAGEHAMMKSLLLSEQAEKREISAERERLREDAERYRWLRGREDGRYMTVYAFRTDVDEVCLGEELDATIDAAMAAEQSDERREA